VGAIAVWPLVLRKYATCYSRSQGINRIPGCQLFLLQQLQ